jgi:hypothetical protein
VDGPIAEAPTLRPVVAWTAIVALIILAVMRELLTKQIERLSSNEPLERIPPVRGTREE